MKKGSEYLYEFDTFGYCIIPELINKKQIDEISGTLDLIKSNNYYLENTDVVLGQMREDGTAFISNIASASKLLAKLAFDERVLSVLHLVMGESFCLNHSNSLFHLQDRHILTWQEYRHITKLSIILEAIKYFPL